MKVFFFIFFKILPFSFSSIEKNPIIIFQIKKIARASQFFEFGFFLGPLLLERPIKDVNRNCVYHMVLQANIK
jgi:hypothetical protein